MSIVKQAFETIVIEQKMPWRVEQWLKNQQWYIRRRFQRYQQRERRLFSQFIKSGDLVFDIGANVGDKAHTFLSLGSRVICVEPDARCQAQLENRFISNLHTTLVRAGVGAEVGQAKFYASAKSARSTFDLDRMQQLGDDCQWDQASVVPITTLDNLIAQYGVPQFCKIDVEGFEPQVIDGLSQPVGSLSFEFHGELISDVEHCVTRLDQLGMHRFNVLLYPVGGRKPFHQLDRLFMPVPISKDQLLKLLDSLKHEKLAGDIYAFRS